ncbi:hypothetical protein WA1_24150 [Scytonema hofmannii PCC 7110]|uniref:Uncharacterized protein n=1 Tax=Scytonema hofmannii PCC 7110 TaxID=128403 RepID=A0A139X7U8_9CYAN|nr:hypothetical protein WA1_24150 [Scytonema hofmannii PCC 7110]USN26946.1 hypothetical protein [synthetic construct]
MFWQDLRVFAPAWLCQKNIWEGSPDEGGDSVATTAVIRTVTRTASLFQDILLLLGAHLSCLATAASELTFYGKS